MRFNVVVHEQSLICRGIFFGKRGPPVATGSPQDESVRCADLWPVNVKPSWLSYKLDGPQGRGYNVAMIELLPDEYFMREALRQAQKAYAAEEVPVGAVVAREGKIIARAYNQVELLKDATAHAEMLALTQAEAAVGNWRLTDCDLYVTKEPCAMCAGAVVHTRIRRVIFGCTDLSAGAAGSMMNLLQMQSLNHRCEIRSGVLQNECAAILQEFFRKRREE
jgi:tRNA(adenine34) deaminase